MPSENQKLKLMHLAQIFEQETDDDHGLTGPQLIELLAERGVEVERKTLYRDIDCLRKFGYDIQKYRRSPVEYGLATREFQEPELLLLADAVQSSRFLTKRKAKALVKAVAKLGSKHMARDLEKHVHVEGRIRTQNESVFYNVDAIQRAISAKRKVEFSYFKYNAAKKQVVQHDGKRYCETPVQLTYIDDYYYLVVWNDKHESFATYRVDRMKDIEVSGQSATRNNEIASFDIAKHQQRVFGMFNGTPVSVTLLVRSEAMSAVIDRFGRDVASSPAGEGAARVVATVMEAPTFYGWLTQFGADVMIEGPEHVRESYVGFLQSVIEGYR